MGFFKDAIGGLRRSMDLDTFGTAYTKSDLYAWFNVLDGIDSGAVLSSLKAFSQNTWVNKCVNVISASGSMLPLELYRGTTKVSDTHPFLQFMRAPNPYLTREQLFYRTLSIMLLQGECFWWIIRRGSRVTNNMPESVWIIDPRYVRPELTQTNPQSIKYWEVSSPFGVLRLDPLDIAHFKIPHPDKPFRGGSPLEAAGLAVSADVAAARWNYRFFRNSALPAGILTTDQPLTEAQARQVRARWEQTSKGEENAHRVQVTYRGLKWMPVQNTAKDMEFNALRTALQQEICAAYGVPSVKLGLLDGATYANSDAQKELFWTQTVMPYLRLIESTLDQMLLRDDGLESYFNTDGVEDLRTIVARKVEIAVKMFSIGWPLNLIDNRLDIGMGDVEWGDEGFLPFNLQLAKDVVNPPEPPALPGVPPGADPNATPPAEDEDPKPPKDLTPEKAYEYAKRRIGAALTGPGFRALVHTSLEKLQAEAATRLLPNETPAIDVTDETRGAIVEVLRATNGDAVLDDLKRTVGVPVVPHRASTVYDHILEWSPRLYVAGTRAATKRKGVETVLETLRGTDKELKRIGAKYIKQGVAIGVNSASELLGVEFDGPADPEVQKFIAEKVLKIVGVNETTEEQIRAAIAGGIDDGLGTDEIADAIVDVFDVAYSRARTISRTELSSSNNGGRFATFKAYGAERHGWVASGDDRTRETHSDVDGEEVEMGEQFPIVNLIYPGDPDGDPSEIVNCRCVAVPVIGDEGRLFGAGYIRSLSIEARDALWRKTIAGLTLPERHFTTELKKLFRKQKADVLAAFKKIA